MKFEGKATICQNIQNLFHVIFPKYPIWVYKAYSRILDYVIVIRNSNPESLLFAQEKKIATPVAYV